MRGLCGGIALRNWCSGDKGERKEETAGTGKEEQDVEATQREGRRARLRHHSRSTGGGSGSGQARGRDGSLDKSPSVAPNSSQLRTVGRVSGKTAKDGEKNHKKGAVVRRRETWSEQCLPDDQARLSGQAMPSATSVTVSTALCSHTPQTSTTGRTLGAGNDLELHFNHLKMASTCPSGVAQFFLLFCLLCFSVLFVLLFCCLPSL